MFPRTKNRSMFRGNSVVPTINVQDGDGSELVFNLQTPRADYFGLRKAEYGPKRSGFVQSTFGELAPLVYFALETRDPKKAKKAIGIRSSIFLGGKTFSVTGSDGLLVDDNPDLNLIKDLQVYGDALRNRLGSRQENGVTYSDDGSVRFTPHGFQLDKQDALSFSKNSGLIALVGSRERADMLAEASKNYTSKPWLGKGFSRTGSSQLRVPLVVLGNTLIVDGCDPYNLGTWFSFGVRRGTEGTAS